MLFRSIRAQGANPCGVVIALDRMEVGTGALSAVQEVNERYNIPVVAVATLDDLVKFLSNDPGMQKELAAVAQYREKYGVKTSDKYAVARTIRLIPASLAIANWCSVTGSVAIGNIGFGLIFVNGRRRVP